MLATHPLHFEKGSTHYLIKYLPLTNTSPGNFVILPHGLLTLLEENPSLEYINPQSGGRILDLPNPRFVKRGRIGNISVYHDTYAKWDSHDVIVGKTSEGHSHPVFIFVSIQMNIKIQKITYLLE